MGIRSIQNTIISKSQSGKRLSRQIDGQRFAFTAKIITGKRSDIYGELMSFIMKQRSQKENFTIIPPELEDARGVETGTLAVVGSHTAGDTTIAIDGFASDTANRLRKGDYIKFNGHTKIYMVVEDVTSSSNAATVTIEPPLLTTLANDESKHLLNSDQKSSQKFDSYYHYYSHLNKQLSREFLNLSGLILIFQKHYDYLQIMRQD